MKAQLQRWNRAGQLEVHLLHPRVKEIMVMVTVKIVQGILERFQDLLAWLSPFSEQAIYFNVIRFDDDGGFWLARKLEHG